MTATSNRSSTTSANRRAKQGARGKRRKAKAPKLSRMRRPEGMTLEAWQTELRRQFGAEQDFQLKNTGEHPFFSDFLVTNPESKSTYRVSIRGTRLAENFCSCPDFATNTLGTCKHIEYVLEKLRRRRGGKKALKDGFQPPYSEVYLAYGLEREVRFRPGSECPTAVARLTSSYFDTEGRLLPDAFTKLEKFISQASADGHALRVYDDALSFVAEVRDIERRQQTITKAFPRGEKSAAFKRLLKGSLYAYQRRGALFAAAAGRCLIADEMGLGKTIQAIAAAEIMAAQFGVERVLVVCPTSLKHQWEREISKFTDRSTAVIGGLRTRRQQQFAEPSFYKIANYDTIHADLELVEEWSPDLVILDEAQRIKNWATRTARSVKRISSPYAIVLTGTPLENRLEELISIVQFVDRHRLGPTFRFLHDHQIREDETGRVVGYQNLDRVSQTLEPIMLRRRKEEVLSELPGRIEKQFFVPMTPQQQQHHDENRDTVAKIVRKWRRVGFLTEAEQRRLMISLQNMRMSCDSTYLLDQSTDSGFKADELVVFLEELFEQQESKVVIFSQWLRMHELLTRRFQDKQWGHVLFHGGVDSSKRMGLIDQFRSDDRCAAFLSTDAGGVGLNLQHANVVVNMDLPWNPAVLEQRIGRVHRLGQKRPVQVVNFVAQGTIEEGMIGVLGFKKSLFAGVLDGGEKEVFLGGSRLKRFLESVETITTNIPEKSVASPPAAESVYDDSPTTAQKEAAQTPRNAGTPIVEDPWASLLQQGAALIQQWANSASAGNPNSASAGNPNSAARARSFGPLVETDRDPETGQPFLKVPMPNPEIVQQALGVLQNVLGNLQGGQRK